jgi:hypothetical protein
MIYLLFIFNFLLFIDSWAELILGPNFNSFYFVRIGPSYFLSSSSFADGPIANCYYFGLLLVSSILV